MKNFVSVALIALIVTFSANLCTAQDVWIHTAVNSDGGRTETYIMTETIKEDYNNLRFAVCTKAVSGYNSVYITEFIFAYRDGNWYSTWAFNGMLNPAGWELARNNVIPPKAFNACKPYVRLARDYPL